MSFLNLPRLEKVDWRFKDKKAQDHANNLHKQANFYQMEPIFADIIEIIYDKETDETLNHTHGKDKSVIVPFLEI